MASISRATGSMLAFARRVSLVARTTLDMGHSLATRRDTTRRGPGTDCSSHSNNRESAISTAVLTWVDGTAFTVGSTGLHTVVVYAREDGVKVDQIVIDQSSATPNWSAESARTRACP